MKKNLLCLTAGVTMMMGLASCSDDQELSINMAGEWSGRFGSTYTIEDRDGYERTYEADQTYLRFTPDHTYATHGFGTEVDYYDRGPYDCMYYQFDWEVDDERIILTFPGYPEMDLVINHFEMSDHYFAGRIGNSSFSLRKISDYYDWSPYAYGHGYHTRGGDTRAESETAVIIGRGNSNK